MIRFVGQIGAVPAVAGAVRHAARHRTAPAQPVSSRDLAQMFVEIVSLTPKGGAKAP